MLKQSIVKRVEILEEAAAIPRRVHFIFDEGQGRDGIDAEIKARIAEGHAKEGDCFHTFSWRVPDPSIPERPIGYQGL